MKKMTLTLFFTATAAAVSLGVLIGSFAPRAQVGDASVPALSGESAYVLREYEGRVAVYCGAETAVPATVTEIEVRLLPERDRQLLTGGIGVDDPDELCMLLEDLGS